MESAIELETDPALKPWVWYARAYQQFQVAFLLLAEIYAFPQRREADRIWKCFDYIFEPPIGLTHQEKAVVIITEIRDRMVVYREARKLKVPIDMLERISHLPQGQSFTKPQSSSHKLYRPSSEIGEMNLSLNNDQINSQSPVNERQLDIFPGLVDSSPSLDTLPDIDWV